VEAGPLFAQLKTRPPVQAGAFWRGMTEADERQKVFPASVSHQHSSPVSRKNNAANEQGTDGESNHNVFEHGRPQDCELAMSRHSADGCKQETLSAVFGNL
jgi:hypothetical protein